jgi:hypothetical protein
MKRKPAEGAKVEAFAGAAERDSVCVRPQLNCEVPVFFYITYMPGYLV